MNDVEHPLQGRTSRLLRAGRTIFARTWLVFSVTAFVIAVIAAVLDHDHLLKSDDPYLVGGLVAGVCACLAFLFGLVGALGGSPAGQRFAYFGPAFALSAFLIGVDLVTHMPEGQGIPTFLSVVIAAASSAAYVLTKIPLTRGWLIGASIPGLLYFLGCCAALISMSARNF